MKRTACICLMAAAMVLAPVTAFACSQLTPAGMRREAARQRHYLASADRIVDGTLTFEPQGEDDELIVVGKLEIPVRRGPPEILRVFSRQEIGCGFPNFPLRLMSSRDGLSGRFYLKREDGYFDVLHFEPLGGDK